VNPLRANHDPKPRRHKLVTRIGAAALAGFWIGRPDGDLPNPHTLNPDLVNPPFSITATTASPEVIVSDLGER